MRVSPRGIAGVASVTPYGKVRIYIRSFALLSSEQFLSIVAAQASFDLIDTVFNTVEWMVGEVLLEVIEHLCQILKC